MNDPIFYVKLGSIFIGSFLGVLSAVTRTEKDIPAPEPNKPDRTVKRLSTPGKFSVVGMVISFVAAFVLQIAEERDNTQKERDNARNESKRADETRQSLSNAQATLKGVERLLWRINDVELSALIEFPIVPSITNELEWLNDLYATPRARESFPKYRGVFPLEDNSQVSGVRDKLNGVKILQGSPYNPFCRRRGEELLRSFLTNLSLQISIKKSLQGATTNVVWRAQTLSVPGEMRIRFAPGSLKPQSGELRIVASTAKPPDLSDGSITSIHDLVGSVVIITLTFDDSLMAIPELKRKKIGEFRKNVEIDPSSLQLHIDGLHFDLNRFRAPLDPEKDVETEGIVFQLPSKIDKLLEATR